MTLALLFHAPATTGYLLVFALVAAETAGALLPGETALIVAGSLAGQGRLSLPLVWLAGATGALVGDSIGYLIGEHGLRLLAQWLPASAIERGEAFYAKHGPKAVLLARWLPGLRLIGAWFAGAARMPPRQFLLWNATGAALWAATISLAAYTLGRTAGALMGTIAAVLLVLLGGLVATRLAHRRGGRTQQSGSDEPDVATELATPILRVSPAVGPDRRKP